MLKSIVNGAEHDIVRIPMRSKQLWNEVVSLIDTNLGKRYGFIIDVPGTYTVKVYGDILSTDFVYGNVYSNGTYSSNYYLVVNGRISAYTFTIADGEHATIYDANADSESTALGKFARWDIMANEGSTALPYVPYGMVEGWEVRDNQNRLIWGREDELQTTTGNLLFKGYDLPVKVNSLLGNSVQNGTPSPDNVVIPEFCGVRTENLFDYVSYFDSEFTDYNEYFDFSSIQLLPNTTYTLSTSIREYGSNPRTTAFIVATTNQTPTTASGGISSISPVTITTENDGILKLYKRISGGRVYPTKELFDAGDWLMINIGSTALLYEPYGYKISFDNNGENLWDNRGFSARAITSTYEHVDTNTYGTTLSTTIGKEVTITQSVYPTGTVGYQNGFFFIDVDFSKYEIGDKVTLSFDYVCNEIHATESQFTTTLYAGKSNNSIPCTLSSGNWSISGRLTTVITIISNMSPYVEVRLCGNSITVKNIMLNSGNTPLPYSPYLNKTTPIYLSEVPTIRRIKKLVLTGAEGTSFYNKNIGSSDNSLYYIRFTSLPSVPLNGSQSYCTHLQNLNYTPTQAIGINIGTTYNVIYFNFGLDVMNAQPSGNTVAGLKEYLTTQYQNGTPVTIWYILAEPQTGIVNEPLAKIGNYTDELTEISVHNLSAPLYGIGDYKDILNLSTGVLTRNIRKLVLTGEEANWGDIGGGANAPYRITLPDIVTTSDRNSVLFLSSHYLAVSNNASWTQYSACVSWSFSGGTSVKSLQFRDTSQATLSAFKSYLAEQYANGTPVTIWYVLDSPETETVTVPTGMTGEIEGYLTQISTPTPEHPSIPKWNGKEETGGTYAVTVYDLPEIPTTTGQNTLTIETEKIHGVTSPLCGIGDYKDVLNLSTGVVTRKIKKWVLTGNETIGNYEGIIYLQLPDDAFQGTAIPFSTHYIGTDISIADSPNYSIRQIMTGYWGGSVPAIRIKDSSHNSSGIFQDFITTQYTAGTPVVIWYILSTPETETITVPYGLECSVEGYLTQSGIPTPSNPITPESNGILESGGTYAVEVSLVPSNLTVKGHIKPVQ